MPNLRLPTAVEILPRLFLGDQAACERVKEYRATSPDFPVAVVHAEDTPCFLEEFHSKTKPSKRKALPNRAVVLERAWDLYLNFPDNERWSNPANLTVYITATNAFISQHLPHHPVLVHCHLGQSRSASLVFFYLVETGRVKSRAGFKKIYPGWSPNPGISRFIDRELAKRGGSGSPVSRHKSRKRR